MAKARSKKVASVSKKPTIRDVARLAGVGVGSVSRVLNKSTSVKAKTRQRVERVIADIGFEPDRIAGSMRRLETFTVGCVIRDFNLPGFSEFLRAAESTFKTAGYTMLLANTEDRKDQEISLLRTLSQRRTDGIIMTVSSEEDPELLDALNHSNMKIVLINRDPKSKQDRLLVDHRNGIVQATKYLLSLGHRDIALLTSSADIYPGRSRIEGFISAMKQSNLPAKKKFIRAGISTVDEAFRETAALLTAEYPPTALIVAGRALLTGAIRAIHNLGLKIGPDLSLISDSDSDFAALTTPAITAVRWDLQQWGRSAAQMLLDRLKGGSHAETRRVILHAELVLRDSCMALKSNRRNT